MRVTVYGSHLCPDTLFALNELKKNNVDLDFKNISIDFGALKEFMAIREANPMYVEVKKNNGLGIPLLICENGQKTFNVQDVIK